MGERKYQIPAIPGIPDNPELYSVLQAMSRKIRDIEDRFTLLATVYLARNETAELSTGYSLKPYLHGEISSGTVKPLVKRGFLQHVINGGAHILVPPDEDCELIVHYVNNSSAGAVTTSAFTHVDGSYATTNSNEYFGRIRVSRGSSLLEWIALQ